MVKERMVDNLVNDSEKASTLKMLPTNVTSTPNGTEKGTFLVLELKQDTFQISQVKLDGRNNPEIESENFSIPKTQLFEDIASYLATFKKRRNIQIDLPIGFTFPFTFIENTEDESTLISWSKRVFYQGVENRNMVQLLREAIFKQENYKPKYITFVNDTVGTMMNCGFKHSDCEAGLIVDNSSNICYMEMENTRGNEDDLNSWRRCVKVEWGSFGDNGDLQSFSTIYDQKVDKESEKRGKQCFEKMVSLTYVGEIVRHVLLANDRLMRHDGNHSKLQEKYCLKPGDILTISKTHLQVDLSIPFQKNYKFRLKLAHPAIPARTPNLQMAQWRNEPMN
ncbi:hexokinase-2-like [Pelobates fuscus]|uniref:hexokinase-2-like n=1 Tax=Pelobates fuscus TaxID=191477 RepID=UPI002FE4873D